MGEEIAGKAKSMEELMNGCVELIVELFRANIRWDHIVRYEVGKTSNGSISIVYKASAWCAQNKRSCSAKQHSSWPKKWEYGTIGKTDEYMPA